MQAPKVASKQYETDTDNNTDTEGGVPTSVDPANPMGLPEDSMPLGYKRENLDFNNILK
jgi:hypothetical protein